jgi:hypothetical protein
MEKVTVQKLVGKVCEAYEQGKNAGTRLVHKQFNFEETRARQSIRRLLMGIGAGLAIMAFAFKESWITKSPLLSVMGCVINCVFLIISSLVGLIFWGLSGSPAVAVWAKEMLPFGIQPYRSISAIPVVFIILALLSGRFFRALQRIRLCQAYWPKLLVWIRMALIVITACVWFFAVSVNTTSTKVPGEQNRQQNQKAGQAGKSTGQDTGKAH